MKDKNFIDQAIKNQENNEMERNDLFKIMSSLDNEEKPNNQFSHEGQNLKKGSNRLNFIDTSNSNTIQ